MIKTGKLLLVFLLILTFSIGKALAATYSVTITSTAYIPSTLQVSAGDQVIFLNSDTATQSARTAETAGFNTGDIGPGANKTVTLATAGTYAYYSAYDANLTGTITVAAAAGGITDTTDTTSTVTTTQPQPVSGVFEVLLALVGGGCALLGFGWQARKRGLAQAGIEIINLPLISSSAEAERDANHRP